MLDLAIFGSKPKFETPKSTSNLVQPNKQSFLNYLKEAYSQKVSLSGNSALTEKLEARLAVAHGAKYCVAVVNGLWGIVMAISALRLQGKREIVMPSLTYRRMADIAAWLDMVPHFCDVDYDTLGVKAEHVEPCINESTALILAPHPIVNLCDIDGLIQLSKRKNIPLLFDSVEASFAEFNNGLIGGFGDAECFSVHASKFLNGFEGGYITTNDLTLAEKLKLLRNNGINGKTGRLESTGMDGKLIAPHVAMTLACLDDLSEQIERNKTRFLKYKQELAGIKGIELVEYSLTAKRSFKNILIKLNTNWILTRSQTIEILQAENMVVRPYYYPPLHKKPNQFKTINGNLSNTELLMEHLMLMPCGEFVTLDDIEIVAKTLRYISNHAEEIKKSLTK